VSQKLWGGKGGSKEGRKEERKNHTRLPKTTPNPSQGEEEEGRRAGGLMAVRRCGGAGDRQW